MPQGKIKKLSDKGFGFISQGSDKDTFFHASGLRSGQEFDTLQVGDQVEFTNTVADDGRPRATDVAVIGG